MTTPDPAAAGQHDQLQLLLLAVDRTRASLPSLLASTSSSTSNNNRDEHAQLYRAANAECLAAIQALAEQLDALEPVLQAAEASEAADGEGIVVLPRDKKESGDAWEKVGSILSGGEGRTGSSNGKGKGRERYRPEFPPPTSRAELEELVAKWQTRHPRVRVQIVGAAEVREPRELRVTLRGVLKAIVALRWKNDATEGGRMIGVDLVGCYGLKEDVRPPLLPLFSPCR